MANGLLLRLRERELSASPAERNVIAYVSAHPHEVVGLSVRGLADATFSSPSSILLVGDPDLSDAGWTQFAHVSAGYVDLQCELEPGYAYVRGQIHHDRPDSSTLIFRSQESRTTLKPDSVPMDAGAGLFRKAGSIAVSNSSYGRYGGELEIARVDLPGEERMNVAGHITPEAMELLPFIKRGFGVRFV